jgi:L-2-hydroxyglutarate oxidase LhgO
MNNMYDICIIGGGQSGLVTCKTFIESGKSVIVLEKCKDGIGMFSTIKEKNSFKWSTSLYEWFQ